MSEEKREVQNIEAGGKLTKELLESVSGGYLYSNGDNPDYPYEMIDDLTGEVICRFARKEDAVDSLKYNGYSAKEITWDQLKTLRYH